MSRAVRLVNPASSVSQWPERPSYGSSTSASSLAVRLRREVRVDKKKERLINPADVQGLQADAVAQLLESCEKTQQKAVAIHPKDAGLTPVLFTLVPGPLCVNTLTVLTKHPQRQQKREDKSKKGARQPPLGPGY